MFLSKLFYPQDFRSIKSLFMTILIILNSIPTYADDDLISKKIDEIAAKHTPPPPSQVKPNEFNIYLTSIITGNEIFPFKETEKQFQLAKPQYDSFTENSCSEEALDATYLTLQAPKPNTKSGAGTSNEANELAIASGVITDKNRATCSRLNGEIKKIYGEAEKNRAIERTACLAKATTIKNNDMESKLIKENPAMLEQVNRLYASNQDACTNVASQIKTRIQRLLAFAEEHWIAIAGLLTTVGGGAYLLSKSGKKQADDLTTNPNAIPTDSKNAAAPSPAPVATPELAAEITPTFQRPSDQAYCQNSIRPVECFVTPSCDLACAANRYGIENYSGMGSDTRMIDKNGKIVDPTTARARNPGAATAASGEGGSGSGSKSGSGPGEVSNSNAETAANEPINTRNARNFNYDDSGFSGRGFGSDSYSMDREPATASARSLAQLQNVQTKDLAAAATGPVLQSKENIFNLIYEASRTQCVRDLVYCDGK